MEKSKFDEIVDTLLTTTVKSSSQRNAKYVSADIIRRESTLTLKPRGELKPCMDCGNLVQNRVVEYAVYDLARRPHWKKKCVECGVKGVISNPVKDQE